jgi:A/G-specific adenine glycosylase
MFKPLLQWSQKEFPDLPWRKNRSLYGTLVSEIMLQQTTVSTVKNHYQRFLGIYPDLESLTQASESELLVAWKGLGYYRRARNLKKIAEGILQNYAGTFPQDTALLQTIPGIGPYTANAIVAIGWNQRALAVDANLERVLSRIFGIQLPKGPKLQLELQQLFQQHVAFKSRLDWRGLNEALMDLGRTFCQARKASCELCPMRQSCVAFEQGQPLQYPLATSPVKTAGDRHQLHLLRLFVFKNNKLLVYQKKEGQWLAGQYEVPTFIIHSSDPKLLQYPVLAKKVGGISGEYKTNITKYNIRNSMLAAAASDVKKMGFSEKLVWRDVHCPQANFSTATMKGLSRMMDKEKNRDQE